MAKKGVKTPLILSYYDELSEKDMKQEAKCRVCSTSIKGKAGVTSNFVTHLKRMHPSKYEEYCKKKRGCTPTSSGSGTQVKLNDLVSGSELSTSKYTRSHARQKAITARITDMVVKDLLPASIVENEGFRELIATLDPRYTMVSRQHIQYTLLPQRAVEVTATITSSLQNVKSCSLTLDIWSSRRMHAYLGLTCHFISDEWRMVSYLLACRQMSGSHTGDNIISEFEEIIDEFNIRTSVFKAVTDNASNMKKAFANSLSLPGFTSTSDAVDEDTEVDTDLETEMSEHEEDTEDMNTHFDSIMEKIPDRVSCFAHTLQLCVKDGLTASARLTSALNKVARIVNHVKKSTIATEKLESLSGKTLISKNETRWNSQLKMVRRVLQVDVNDAVEKKELHLSAFDKNLLREFVEIFERFEDATDIVQGEEYVSISLAIPCYFGLKKHLDEAKKTSKYSHCIITALDCSLDKRLGGIVVHPLYCISTLLDPQFKLKWCNEVQSQQVKDMTLSEMSLLHDPHFPQEANQDDRASSPPPPKKTKMSKLFSYLQAPPAVGPPNSCIEELDTYLNCEPTQLQSTDSTEHSRSALSYWRANAVRFPKLSQMARKFLSVPATSAPIERVFSQAGKILRSDRSRLLPKNFEKLVFLKVNQDLV